MRNVLALCMCLLALAALPALCEGFRLRYDFSTPEIYYRVTGKAGTTAIPLNSPMAGEYKPQESLQESLAYLVMKSTGGESGHTLVVSPHSLRMYAIVGDKKKTIPMRKKDLRYFTYTLTLDDAGKVLSIKLPEEFTKVAEGADTALTTEFGFVFQQLFPPLPGKSLQSGDTWEYAFETPFESETARVCVSTKIAYAFSGTKECNGVECLFVKFDARYQVTVATSDEAPEGMVVAGTGTGQGSGVLYFDPKRGQMEACGLRSRSELTMKITADERQLEQLVRKRAEIRYERVDTLPPEEPKKKTPGTKPGEPALPETLPIETEPVAPTPANP